MKTKLHPKYLFSQISGVLIGCASLYPTLKAMLSLWPNFVVKSHSHFFNATIIGFVLIMSVILTIAIWGKLLVLFGVLTKEEAKGYPYSKPWGNNRNLR